MAEFNLDELNKQMQFFQNEYNTQNTMQNTMSSINFPARDMNNSVITTQIKRPTRSGDHRNDINDKMAQMNLSMPIPTPAAQPNGNMMIHSRNNSNYPDIIPSNNASNSTQQLNNKRIQNNGENKLASYYNHNFDTLQGMNSATSARGNAINTVMFNKSTNLNPVNTHDQGVTFINVNNLLSGQGDDKSNRINDNGYHSIEEKKMDYRQNMNNKIDNFIFSNPYESNPINPILLAAQNRGSNQRDSRMVIQDSSKDFYRQEANNRLSQYSPLSRAANIPIDIANLSVNDFYSNGNGFPEQQNHTQTQMQDDDQKALINARMSQYAPLARTVQYQTQQGTTQSNPHQQSNMQNNQSDGGNYATMVKYHQQQMENYYKNQQNMQNLQNKPKQWQQLDTNPSITAKLPVYDQLPVISNKNY